MEIKLRKCPNCGQEVSQYADICYFCDYDLKNNTGVTETTHIGVTDESPEESFNGPNPMFGLNPEPSGCSPWGYAALIIAGNYVAVFILAFLGTMAGGEDAAYALAAFWQIGLRVWIGVAAAKSYKKGHPTGWSYAGWIVLAFIPIGAWFAMYQAGKFLAWKYAKSNPAGVG